MLISAEHKRLNNWAADHLLHLAWRLHMFLLRTFHWAGMAMDVVRPTQKAGMLANPLTN